ncbi:unnamed protein product [Rotaria sordida]|uniref:Uncharacterized protein n=1 Tax=Rotaria sordida TaxID=392033 RepID=A0A819A4U1_9BILA|nr:unnamed protein product [Rotaria sordida]CAF3776585.1 unnamed protein product [Rotaria sordida]
MLNPIEIAWVFVKNYIRDQNTSFKLNHVRELTSSWLAACDELTSVEFFKEVKKYEATFKKADHYVESIESTLVETDDDEESDPDLDGDDNSKNSDYE